MVDGGTSVSNRQSKAVGGGTQDGDKSVAVKDGGKPQNQVPNPAVNNNTLQESSMGEPMREVHLLDETLTTSSSTGVSSSPPSSSQAALVTSTTLENSTDTDEIHPGQKDAGLDLLDSTQCQADHHISSERSDPSLEPHAQPHVSNELPCKQDEKEVDGSGQEEEEEDWEASWGEGLCQLKPAALVKISRAPPPVTVAIKQTNPIATVNLVKDVEGTVPPGTSERLDHPAGLKDQGISDMWCHIPTPQALTRPIDLNMHLPSMPHKTPYLLIPLSPPSFQLMFWKCTASPGRSRAPT